MLTRRIVCAAATLAAALVGSPASADASAATRAACTMRAHIELSRSLGGVPAAGSFHSTHLGTIDCAGTLDGALSDGIGWIDAGGGYESGQSNPFGAPVDGFGTCSLANLRPSFLASAPRFPSNRRFIYLNGTVHVTPTLGLLLATGSGRAGTISSISPGSEPVTYTAVGAFQPDHGQNCTNAPIQSGTLTERFVIVGPTR